MWAVADDSESKRTTPSRVFLVLRGQRKAGESEHIPGGDRGGVKEEIPYRGQLLRKQLEERPANSHCGTQC